jgi:hypothetical protein
MPAGFIGRPSSEARTASLQEVMALHGCWSNLAVGIIMSLGARALFIVHPWAWSWASIIADPLGWASVDLWGCASVIAGVVGSGWILVALVGFAVALNDVMKVAWCPCCNRGPVYFGELRSFSCPYCKQRLMGQETRLYWLG